MSKFNNPWDVGGEYWSESAALRTSGKSDGPVKKLIKRLAPGRVTFHDYPEDLLSEIRVLPENKNHELITPVNDKRYSHVDGFFVVSKSRPWYKIPNNCWAHAHYDSEDENNPLPGNIVPGRGDLATQQGDMAGWSDENHSNVP